MAGHIDHGKTTLTKALTGVETDRLKEEKERKISIEPGFAPLMQTEDVQISIIDVPGHERFIRQMIAGVAGIDVVVLVVAADEGVMPQTREHLHILSLLGIGHGVIAITKTDGVEADFLEIVQEDIKETVAGTFLEKSAIYFVDSVSCAGIESFKQSLISFVQNVPKRSTYHSFRLPIDHVFTVKGQGVVVRGTVFDGHAELGNKLTVLPEHKKVRVRHMQSHQEQKEVVYAGQRVAMNLGGITHHELRRGDVLVKDEFYTPTSQIDIAFTPLHSLQYTIKQRQFIKLYVGTSEVTGKIVFYDRNELAVHDTAEVLCQLQLDEEVVVTRGDRFILRRATPIETLGGGWIMNPNGTTRRFGKQSIDELREIKDGTAEERIFALLKNGHAYTKEDIVHLASVTDGEFTKVVERFIHIGKQMYTKRSIVVQLIDEMKNKLTHYHETYPLRVGMNKAELVSALRSNYPEQLIEFVLNEATVTGEITGIEQFIALSSFIPTFPQGWKKRIERMIAEWKEHGADVEKMATYFSLHHIDESLQTDLYYYLLHMNEAYEFDEERLIARSIVLQLRDNLYAETKGEPFTLQIARDIIGLSRKNLVPLLELFDRLQFTERKDNERVWLPFAAMSEE